MLQKNLDTIVEASIVVLLPLVRQLSDRTCNSSAKQKVRHISTTQKYSANPLAVEGKASSNAPLTTLVRGEDIKNCAEQETGLFG